MSLTYQLVYKPDVKTTNLNYLCSDNKIHFRFNDYDDYQIINGFEKKLTYLMTYLINFNFIPNMSGRNQNNTLNIINEFLKNDNVKAISEVINTNYNLQGFRGFKAAINYKKNACMPFGRVNVECFPIVGDEANLEIFLKTFKLNLYDYLFNDAYIIIISNNKTQDIFKNKFFKRQQKKLNRTELEKNDLVKLW